MMWCMRMPHIQVFITRTVYSWISDHMWYVWYSIIPRMNLIEFATMSQEIRASCLGLHWGTLRWTKSKALQNRTRGDESCCGERLILLPAELVMLIHRCSMVTDSKCACSPKDIAQMRQSNGSLAFLEAYILYRPNPNHMAKTPTQAHSFLACPWHRGWSKETLWQMQQRHTGSQATKTVMGEWILHHNHWVVSLQTGRFLCIVLINQGPRLHRIYVGWRLCRYAQPMLEMLAKLALLSKFYRNPKVGNPKSRKDSKYLATGDLGQEFDYSLVHLFFGKYLSTCPACLSSWR